MKPDMRYLADLLQPDPTGAPQIRLRQGVVQSTSAGPSPTATVTIGGSSTSIAGVRMLGSYTPTATDVVQILQNGTDLLILGTLVASGSVLSGTGIDPTGTTDSGAALQAKMNADTTNEPYLPAGTYVTSTSLTIPAGKRLTLAKGATLRGTAGLTVVAVAADATLFGGTVDGGTALYCTSITGDRARIDTVTISNGTYGVGHGNSFADLTVERCRFFNNTSYGVLVENAAVRTMIRGNTFLSTTNASQQGVTVKNNTGGTPVDTSIVDNVVDVPGIIGLEAQAGSLRIVITGNVVRRATIGISLSSAKSVSVTGNTIVGCSTYGIEAAQATADSTISGNTVISCGTGICVTSPTSSPASINVNVIGNTITNASGYGIQVEFGGGHTIANNTIADPVGIAIFLNNGPIECHVSGNHVRRSVTSGNCIQCNSGSNNTYSGNSLQFVGGGGGYGIYSNGEAEVGLFGNSVAGGQKAYAFTSASNARVIGNSSRNTTEHSIFTQTMTNIFVDAHYYSNNGGVGIDLSGASAGRLGTYMDTTSGNSTWAGQQHTSSKLGLYGVAPVVRAPSIPSPTSDTVGTKAAIDALRTAVFNLGITL